MTFKEDLTAKIREFTDVAWGEIPNGYAVPTPNDLTFSNTGRRLDACVLYADICGSTAMVNDIADTLAAEYYKAYLHCAAKIIKRNSGEITAYDGDRVMAVFLGDSKEDDAVGAALELSYAVDEIINPEFSGAYPASHRRLRHTVGIDASTVLVTKTGVRVDSDLVWVGPAANYAAKLNSFDGLDSDYPIRVTHEVLSALSHTCLVGSSGELMWQGPYTNFDPRRHYRTNFQRAFA
jgi:class 3 adenylate cyclase